MLQISKNEAAALRKKDSSVKIAITSRQKNGSRKHYYVEENLSVKKFLTWYRKNTEKIIYSKGVN